MLFLNFIDELLEALGDILWKVISSIFNIIFIVLCQIIYPFISWMFDVFIGIAKTEILTEININQLMNKIVLIMAIVMTFYITFEFVKYTVSPDNITDKQKGAFPLISRIIIAIILIAFVPTIFEKATQLQNIVINKNVIGKLVLMGTDLGKHALSDNIDDDITDLGKNFTGDLYGSFIRVDCDGISKSKCNDLKEVARNMTNKVKNSKGGFLQTTFDQFQAGIEFSGLLALIFGCFVLYVMFLYCKDVALRQIQMMFLQIISPIAIISYISPKKDGMFQKWVRQCVTTYLDLFIRLAFLYFMFLMFNIVGDNLGVGEIHNLSDDNNDTIIYLFLVAGLMLFIKKVPKILQELFPSGGAASIGYGFSAKNRKSGLFSGAKQVAARTAGAIAGIARTGKAIKNGTLMSDASRNKNGKIGKFKKYGTYANTMGRAAYRGFQAGKDGKIGDAIRTSQETVQTYETLVANGGTVLGHDFRGSHYQNIQAGIKLAIEKQENTIKTNEAKSKLVTSVRKAQDAAEDRSRKKIESGEQKIKVTSEGVADLTKSIAKSVGIDVKDKSHQDIANELSAKYKNFGGLTISAGETTSKIYENFKGKVASANSVVTAVSQELVSAEARQDKANLEKTIVEKALKQAINDNNTAEVARLTTELNAKDYEINLEEANIEELKKKKHNAAIEAEAINTWAGSALKELERYAFTRSLDPSSIPAEEKDLTLEGNVQSALNELNNVRAQFNAQLEARLATAKSAAEKAKITSDVKKEITYETGLSDEEYERIMTGKITTFKEYDDIQGVLSGYATRLADQNSTINENIRRQQEEAKTLMANANSNGKK